MVKAFEHSSERPRCFDVDVFRCVFFFACFVATWLCFLRSPAVLVLALAIHTVQPDEIGKDGCPVKVDEMCRLADLSR